MLTQLDDLHGKGKFVPDAIEAPVQPSASENISDDEFESLLDELHGKGQFKPEQVATPAQNVPAIVAAQPLAAVIPGTT